MSALCLKSCRKLNCCDHLQDKEHRELDNLDSAAELRRKELTSKAKAKEEEATAPRRIAPTHLPPTRFSPPQEMVGTVPPPVTIKPQPRVGESFV